MDEAGACSKLRRRRLPEEVMASQKRINFILQRMDNAVMNHEFEKARFYSSEERKERENLRVLCEQHHLDDAPIATVSREDIENVVCRKTAMSVVAIRNTRTN
jgi:ATP-dependent Clp protease ATP-binding subunit ClpC